MSTIKKFEDIMAWQKARELCKIIYELTKLELFSKDFSLKNQIRDSSGSVMDNIAEGFERRGNKEFVQFLSVAKASCGEVKSQLYRALDQNYIELEKFNETVLLIEETTNFIGSFMNYLIHSDLKGTKFFSQNKNL